MSTPRFDLARRRAVLALTGVAALPARAVSAAADDLTGHPDPKWYAKAREMQVLAESWGDQRYGAVVVLGQTLVGLGPSRVVADSDRDAHAERVAIRDAQRQLGRPDLSGAVLYSTSRPCGLCEAAAAQAGVSRMIHGPTLVDAGRPTR